MIDRDAQISEADLHGYADGQLDPAHAARVEAWLADNPDAARKVAAWTRQNRAIRDAFGGDARADATDRAMVAAAARQGRARLRWLVAAACAGFFVAGAAAGGLVSSSVHQTPRAQAVAMLPDASRVNFRIYASEVRHPVEVGAGEEQHLVTWLGKRLGRDIVAPDLADAGFKLVGGRLVPFDGRPGAMLMYEDANQERVTVLIGANPDHAGTGFRYKRADGIGTFYWADGSFGYALSGAVDRETLLGLARRIYERYPGAGGEGPVS